MKQCAGPAVLSGGGTLKPAPIADMVRVRTGTGKAAPSLRLELHAATQDVHGRLHHHVGFASVQDATIHLADYEALLARLYGFYVPFEAAMAIEPERSTWLAGDLAALGHKGPLHALPMCWHVPRLDSEYLRLGALYVAEGSAFGGRELARGLDLLLGNGVTQGRQFFIGRGADTGESWRSYLAKVSAASSEPFVRAEVIRGATGTFAAFETWLNGWSTSPHV